MWPVFLIRLKRPGKTKQMVVDGRLLVGWGKGVTFAEIQVPRHTSLRSIHLHYDNKRFVKNIKENNRNFF